MNRPRLEILALQLAGFFKLAVTLVITVRHPTAFADAKVVGGLLVATGRASVNYNFIFDRGQRKLHRFHATLQTHIGEYPQKVFGVVLRQVFGEFHLLL